MNLRAFLVSLTRLACGVMLVYSQLTAAEPTNLDNRSAKTMQFVYHGDPCGGGNARECWPVAIAFGPIDNDAGSRFESFLSRLRREKKGIVGIWFHSPGGSLQGGMELGEIIRKNELKTFVGTGYVAFQRTDDRLREVSLVRRPVCFSACTIAFMGGVDREISEGAAFGVHQFSGSGREDIAQEMMALLGSYYDRMGVSRKLLDLASKTPSNDIRMIAKAEAIRLRIDNTVAVQSPWKISATNAGEPLISLEADLDQGRTLGVRIRKVRGGAEFRVAQAVGKEMFDSFSGNSCSQSIGLKLDNREIEANKIREWAKFKNDSGGILHVDAFIDERTLRDLGSSRRISLAVPFCGAMREYNIFSDLAIDGLSQGISLLLKIGR
jgi:hypothetical protein